MTQEEFTNLVDTYGADISRWPEQTQKKAKAFIKADPNFADPLLAEARKLDEALETARITPGTDMLKARILNSVDMSSASQPMAPQAKQASGWSKYRAMAAMMVMSFVLGFAGSNYLQSSQVMTDTNSVYADNEWEELADEYGMSDVYEWALLDPAP